MRRTGVRGQGTGDRWVLNFCLGIGVALLSTTSARAQDFTAFSASTIQNLAGTALGDLLYVATSGAPARLAGNTSTIPTYSKLVGVSGAATVPVLAQINFSDIAGTPNLLQAFNVHSYGATGNGSTDDTAAINLAIAACNASGGVLYFPPAAAFYKITATPAAITNWSCNVQGSGLAGPLGAASGTTGISLLEIAYPGPTYWSNYEHNGFIRDMVFDCNHSDTGPSYTVADRQNNGLWIYDSPMVSQWNVAFKSCNNGELWQTSSRWIERSQLENLTFTNNINGVLLASGYAGSSYEHTVFNGVWFNTFASGDALLKITGEGQLNSSDFFGIQGNMAPGSGNYSSIFSLSGGSTMQYVNIFGSPETDSGTGYVFYSDGTQGSANNACGNKYNCVLAQGSIYNFSTANFQGGTWTNSYYVYNTFYSSLDSIPNGPTYGKRLLWDDPSNLIQNGLPYAGTIGQVPPQWTVYSGGTIQLASVTDPNGNANQNAIEYTNDSQYHGAQTAGFMTIPGESCDVSGWYKSGGAGTWLVYWQDGAGNNFNLGSASTWTPFETTFTAHSGLNQGYGSYLTFNNNSATTDTIYLWGVTVTRKHNAGIVGSAVFGGVGGGTAQAQTVTLSPPLLALGTGAIVAWQPSNANTGSGPTLSVNGLTAVTVTKCGATALAAGDLTSGATAWGLYNGTNFELLNPQAAPCGPAVPAMGSLTTFGASSGNTTTSTSWASLGLAMPSVPVNTKVRGRCNLVWEGSSASYTISLGLNTSAAPTDLYLNGGYSYTRSASFQLPNTTPVTTATTTALVSGLTPAAANTAYIVIAEFDLFTSASNPVTVSVYGEVSNASETLTLEPQSSCGWLP